MKKNKTLTVKEAISELKELRDRGLGDYPIHFEARDTLGVYPANIKFVKADKADGKMILIVEK